MLAIAVSGGADSMALALLAADWVAVHGGALLALIVDHGLRGGSAAEAVLTERRLAERSIAGRVLTLRGLAAGSGLAARARAARWAALTGAAREAGALHLLVGHHADDQAETWLMRERARSGPAGLAGMPALRETHQMRILRPLLGVPAAWLRWYLVGQGMEWIDDPSNADLRATRARLRAELHGQPARRQGLAAAAAAAGAARAGLEAAVARELAERVVFSPLGYAVLSAGPISAAALSALWQAIGGDEYPPPRAAMERLARMPGPATLRNLRLLPAGRLGPGWLLVRERPPPPVAAVDGARWDRFVLRAWGLPHGLRIGALGEAATRLRHACKLPKAVMRGLPALWHGATLLAVPGLNWPDQPGFAAAFDFRPARPAAGAPWYGAEAQEV